MLALALLGPLLFAQDFRAPSPFDEVYVLELTADSPHLVDGRGPTAVVELELGFTGTLHLWTRSELDLCLQIADPESLAVFGTDDDSGGGTVPYLTGDVDAGRRLLVRVASSRADELGALELRVVAAPETDATREAARVAEEGMREARRLQEADELDAARRAVSEVADRLRATPGLERSAAVAATWSRLGELAWEVSGLDVALEAWEAELRHRERTLPADHADLLRARVNLAVALRDAGDLERAHALFAAAAAGFERTLPADDLDLLVTRVNLALTTRELGDLAGARELEEAVLATCERTLPEDDPLLLVARANLAGTMAQMGELAGARALKEEVVAVYGRTLPADHPDLHEARLSLAVTMADQGELAGARELQEAALAAYERKLPEDHPELLHARLELARTMGRMGECAGARALEEAVVAAYERTLPEDHPDLLDARDALAGTMTRMGDLVGARALQEAVLAAYERTLPEEHPRLLSARLCLAAILSESGDLEGARALEAAVVEASERTLPEDDPVLIAARGNLAATLKELGDLAGARALEEGVVASFERALPADHPDLLCARVNLATSMARAGELAAALALEEGALAAGERTLPADHTTVLFARGVLALTRCASGDLDGARALLPAQLAGMTARVRGALALAPRQAREVVGDEADRLAQALYLSREAEPDLQRAVLELQETMRLVAGESARALRASEDPEVRALLAEAAEARAALGDLASRSAARAPDGFAAELTRLLQERDRLEREASRRLAAQGVATSAIDLRALARALGEGAALVAYRRTPHWGGEAGTLEAGPDHLLAHVLLPDGAVRRIDLGAAAELEELVLDWRRALGRPLRGRGFALGDEGAPQAGDGPAGEALRERLVDPLLALLDGADTLHVCADDLVFLVPLDALPFEEGVLGDRYRLVNEVSCARLVSAAHPRVAASGLLLVGGVDYGASAAGSSALVARAEVDLRSGTAGFAPLPGTRAEAQALRRRFERSSDAGAVWLADSDATKEALAAAAAGKRWVHVATHGWFEGGLRSTADEEPSDRGAREWSPLEWSPMGLDERVTGMGPMLLCGLALSGANRGRDSVGRASGLLTAEELCSLDLSACELAVLSACETNVGIRRAGQGIQSLQAALYAAGARSSITSLWKVDDAATRRLFELFYTKLWEEELPKAEALWQAKCALRAEGAPVRDWGAWVLTGDPD